MSRNDHVGARALKRSLAITAATALAVTGAAFGSAATANAADTGGTVTPSLTSFDGWAQAGTPSDFDYALTGGHLRYSNDLANPNLYNALAQLNTPTVPEAGEPDSGAANNTFTEEFTVAAESQTGGNNLAIEVDADKGSNRAGGNLLLREDSDHTLNLASFFVPEGSDSDDLGDWVAKTAQVDISQPVAIKYVDHFVTGGQDIVKVYANGKLVITGSTFEGYHDLQEGDKEAVNSILFRTGYRKADPSGFGWTNEYPTSDQQTALAGKGFDFTDIKLTSSNTVAIPAETATKVQLADIGQETTSYPDNAIFVGAAPEGETATPPTSVIDGALQVPATTQILHGFPADARPTDLTGFIDSGLSWNQDGAGATGAFYQIALSYGTGANAHFTTLRPATVTPGLNTAQFDDQWISSHGQETGTLGQLVSEIESAGNVSLFGYGVYAQDATGVTSFGAGSTNYTFAQDPAIAATVSVSGTAQVGQVLTANVDASATTGTTTTYQWYEGSTKITTNGTSKTYTIPYSRVGQQLSVAVTVKKSGFVSGTATSAKTAKVVAGTFASPSVTVTGDNIVGQKLTSVVAVDEGSAAPTGITYQWYRNGSKISGATQPTYTPAATDFGQDVHVHVVLSKSGFTSAPLSTSDVSIGAGEFSIGNFSISGTAKVGKKLTGSVTASITGTSKVYEWALVSGDDEFTILKVSTSNTFTIPSSAKGGRIELYIDVYKAGYGIPEGGDPAETAVIQ